MHRSALRKVFLLDLLVLLSTSRAGSVSIGINVSTSNGSESEIISALAMDPVLIPTAQQPYPRPDPHPIPGKIETEDYDVGGEGIAYHDTTLGNEGGEYRNDNVDIQSTTDIGGGYNVGWIEEGEWLAHTVEVASTGLYDIQVRVASAMNRTISETLPVTGAISWTVPLTRALHIEFDGTDVSGAMVFVATGGWQNWTSVFARRVPLTEGPHLMRIAMDSGGLNVNWISFAASRPPGESPEETINWLTEQMTVTEKITQLHGTDWMDTADNTRLGIPGFRTADGPHGTRGGKSTSFPVGIAMAATWDPELLERVGIAMGKEFLGRGKNQVLGPCLDITRDPRNGRSPESAGEEPYLAGKLGVAFVEGIQSTQAIATGKHFAATNHQQDRRTANHTIDARTWREFYGLPFRMAVQQGGAWAIMNAYNWINGRPSSANQELLDGVLRDEWGYQYYVISDWGSIYTSAAEAINAGCDLEMPHTPGKYPQELPDAITSGDVTTDTLSAAVGRVMRTKLVAGLLDEYPPGDPSDVCSQEHRDLALEVAQKSIVLLKNEEDILPLNENELDSIALIGPSADVAQLDGIGSSVVEPCYAVTPRRGIENCAAGVTIRYAKGCDINSDDTSGFPAATDAARNSDVVIFVGGLDGTQEGEELDRASGSIQLPGQQQALINELAAVNPNIIVVLESGGIVALEQCFDNIKGLVYAFYPGQEGGNAIADILFGDVNPGGKLPVTMPRNDAQLPAWDDLDFAGDVVDSFGYRRFDSLRLTPQYAFGYGLSYTTFEYGNLIVTPISASGDTTILVSVQVTNTGEIAGDEVVQLYLSTDFENPRVRTVIPMPVKQLRGFERVTLSPGQTESVTFALGPEELSFWSVSDDSFRVEAGTYTIHMGGSSDNLILSGTFELNPPVLYDSTTGETSPAHFPVLGNIALNRPVTCSSIEGADYACSNAVDGDLATRWSSQFSDPQWIYMDLGIQQRIERIILRWETAHGQAYQIQTSNDPFNWTDIYTTTFSDGGVDNLDVSGTGRYVRVYATQRGTGWGYSLWEFQVYAKSDLIHLPLVLRQSSSHLPPPNPTRAISVLLDDFALQPLQGDSVYYFNRLGGDRGAVNNSILDWGNGRVTTTISSGNSWGGVWMSLNHPIGEELAVDFSAILPAQVLPPYQSQVTGITAVIADGTPGRTFKLELKDRGELLWKKEIILNGERQVVSSDLPILRNINEFLWVLDHASAGDYVVLESIFLTATTQITDTATAAFVWSYGMLLNNWDSTTGLVRDKARDASGKFDAIQATGSLAAATASAEQLEIVSQADAVQIVSRISDTLLLDLPRFHGLWPHWVMMSPTSTITIVYGTEWSSVDTVIAAVGLLDAQSGLELNTSGTEQMLQAIDWNDLVTPDGISHGYTYTGDPIPYAWDVFGGESWLVELAYAGATGQVAPIVYPEPPTANGSGFIDELAWLYILPPSGQDYWDTDWALYRLAAADEQIWYYHTYDPSSCLAQLDLFGLSAAEVPGQSMVPQESIYQAFGVGGRFASANDGTALLGSPVVVPHYSALIASLRPQEVIEMWNWLIDNGYFSPLNNVESLMFPTNSGCDSAALVWNPLKGSWNLSLQTLGWGRYLAERNGQIPIVWQATTTNPFLHKGYRLLVPNNSPFLSDPADADIFVQTTLIPTAQQPYPGPNPHPALGKIEVNNCDVSGEGVAYYDTTLGNEY
jgi:beta-glucosidase